MIAFFCGHVVVCVPAFGGWRVGGGGGGKGDSWVLSYGLHTFIHCCQETIRKSFSISVQYIDRLSFFRELVFAESICYFLVLLFTKLPQEHQC